MKKNFKLLNKRIYFPEKELLRMVREVSEDRIYDTIEFNEFLQMMSKQQKNYTQDSLRDAFRWVKIGTVSPLIIFSL